MYTYIFDTYICMYIYMYIHRYIHMSIYICIYICICTCTCIYTYIYTYRRAGEDTYTYGCISMLRYWSSLRYCSLRTLFLFCRQTPSRQVSLSYFYKSIYRHLGKTPPSLYCLQIPARCPLYSSLERTRDHVHTYTVAGAPSRLTRALRNETALNGEWGL